MNLAMKDADTSPSSTETVSAHTDFQSQMPYMGLTLGELTVQQEKLVTLIASGMTIAASGRAAGYASHQTAYEAAKRPAVQQALQYFREQMREEVKFERQNAHSMYMEAYTSSATATEMKNTVDSLVKLHGLATPDTAVQVNINLSQTAKQLERLSDEELLEIAGKTTDYLEPTSE
jgi:phage terminase small subunit